MGETVTLLEPYRGFDAETEFERVAAYGSWHPTAAKLEAADGSGSRIEVREAELEQYFAAEAALA